jgi:hypothetical protein
LSLSLPICDLGGLLVELGQTNIGDLVTFHLRAHRPHPDDVADDRHLRRLVLALAHDFQPDLGVDRAAHLLDCLVEGQALHRLVVQMRDDVTGHDAGLVCRRIVDRRDDLDEALLHRDLDAEPAELAAGLDLHVLEALGIHVARMRIQPLQHAVDGRFDQLAVVGPLDIVGAHPLEHVAEQVQLPIGIRNCCFGGPADEHDARLRDQERQRSARRGAEENQGSLAHHPRTFSLSFAHHGLGSTGVPSLRNSTYRIGCLEPTATRAAVCGAPITATGSPVSTN